MIEVYGKPSEFTASQKQDHDWSTCLVACMNNEGCVMIYELDETECQLFQFGEIRSVERFVYSGNKIAFKRELSAELCPELNPLLTSIPTSEYRITGGQLYTTTLSFSSETWSFAYNITKCPENTQLFLRDSTAVCIGLYTFNNPLCDNYTQASSLCQTSDGTLSGPANSIEYDFIQGIQLYNGVLATIDESKKQLTISISKSEGFKYLPFWIDGISRSAGNNYQFEDETHNGSKNYKWTVGTPLYNGPGYCLYTPNPLGFYISDNYCTVKYCCDAVCWRGAVCQVTTIVTTI